MRLNSVPPITEEPQASPSKRTLANRRNALKSTGPRTAAGKHRVAMNAFKHGLSGQNLCLQTDDSVPYFRLALDFVEDLRPVGVREEQLAQKIIDGNWRLNRAAAIENNLLNNDTVIEAYFLTSDDERSVAVAGQANAWRADCAGPRALESLGRHEGRIARTLSKMTAEFDALQARRLKRDKDVDSFVQHESRAWKFLSTALNHYLAEEAEREAKEQEIEIAEETPEEIKQETPQPLPTKTTSAMALNCDWHWPEDEIEPEPASHYDALRAYAESIGMPLPRFTDECTEPADL